MNVNNSTQGNETLAQTTPILFYVLITLDSILLVWSLFANVLVIAVVYCNQNLRTNMNYVIVNMAVSDLLIPLVAVPNDISWMATNGEWLVDGLLGETLCKLVYFLSELSPFVSSISLVIIAFQRFMAVVYPTRRQILGRKTRWIAISLPWIIVVALFSPYFYIHRLTSEYGYTMCTYTWSPAVDHWTAEVIFYSISMAVGRFAIPLIMIISLYTMIIYQLRRSLVNVRDMMEEEIIRSRQKKNKKIFSMLITICVLFTICWCPLIAVISLHLVAPSFLSEDSLNTMHIVFLYTWYFLPAINPCIYFVFLKDFRKGLKNLCCRKTTTANEPITRRPRTRGGDSNQNPACTPPHINTTTV